MFGCMRRWASARKRNSPPDGADRTSDPRGDWQEICELSLSECSFTASFPARLLPPCVIHLRNTLSTIYQDGGGKRKQQQQPQRHLSTEPLLHSKAYESLVAVARSHLEKEFHSRSGFTGSSASSDRLEHIFGKGERYLKSITLRDVFNVHWQFDARAKLRGSLRVLAIDNSSTGSGRDLFLREGPSVWARGRLWREFDLLIVHDLRKTTVLRARNVCDLLELESHGIRTVEEKQMVAEYVEMHSSFVCLILAGLDAVDLTECSTFMWQVINGEKLRGIRLLVISAPTHDVFNLSVASPFDRHIEIGGFLPESARDYIGTALVAKDALRLVNAVDSSCHLGSMMSSPFYAFAICKVYWHRRELPHCVVDILSSLVLAEVEKTAGQLCTTWREVPEKLVDLVHSIGLLVS